MAGLLAVLIVGVVILVFSSIMGYLRERERVAAQEARFRALSPSNIDNMDGLSFEYYVATLLEHEGFTRVEVTKGSGDFGVDVVASKGSYRYAIQVKRSSGIVSRRAVSDAVAGKNHYSCNAAMVVTNGYLSKQSKQFASSVGCEIIDRDKITEWITRFQASGPGHSTIGRVAGLKNPLQQDSASELSLSSQHREDWNPIEVPSEVLTSIKHLAAGYFPRDFSTQAYVVKEQIEAYRKLAKFNAPGMPRAILGKVLEKVAQDHPSDYSTQLYALQVQFDSYQKIERYVHGEMSIDMFLKVKEQAEFNFPFDFSTQLYAIEDQVQSYFKLARLVG